MELKHQPKDLHGEDIHEGDLLEVQALTELVKVYRVEDELWFQPYDDMERVSTYFSNDLLIIKRKNESFLEWLAKNSK